MRRNLSSGIKVDMYASMHGFIMDQKFKMFRFFQEIKNAFLKCTCLIAVLGHFDFFSNLANHFKVYSSTSKLTN